MSCYSQEVTLNLFDVLSEKPALHCVFLLYHLIRLSNLILIAKCICGNINRFLSAIFVYVS